MGGLIILLATIVPTLLWAPLTNRFVIVAMLSILWMGCIGFLDDYLKIVQGKSRGLVAKWKLVGQVSFGVMLGVFLATNPVVSTETIPATGTTLPFFKYLVVNFAPWLYVAFVTVVITGSSNAVNLTDGLDGLATGLTAISAAAFAVFAYLFGRVDATTYLNLFYLPGAGELAVFCARAHGRDARLPLVQCPSRPRSSWATPAAWRSAARSAPSPSCSRRSSCCCSIGGRVRGRGDLGADPDRHLQVATAHAGEGVRGQPSGLPDGARCITTSRSSAGRRRPS